jgi:REP element-mobilizing transposase RayT
MGKAAARAGTKPRRSRRVRRRRVDKGGQLLIQYPLSWGGRRPGAGRKPKGDRAGEPHQRRPVPPSFQRGALHITIKVADDLPSLRQGRCMRALWFAFAAARDRFGMRLVHFCVQRNHIHLIVEVCSREALLKGMKGLSVRIALQLNRALGRTGPVLADRYHLEVLDSFARIRAAVAYVLNNDRRHSYQHGGWLKVPDYIDPCSSGLFFDGWRGRRVRRPAEVESGALAPPVSEPRGYPLRQGWRRHGLIAVDEIPAVTRAGRGAATR